MTKNVELLFLLNSNNSFNITFRIAISTAENGSSSKTISAFWAKVLANATLCCCPPESLEGDVFSKVLRAKFSNNSSVHGCFFQTG